MPKICYKSNNFRPATLWLIKKANEIITEYLRDGYTLTLRQLYYQLVSRNVIPNQVREYNKLGNAVSDARLAGLIDWDAIEDRGRNLMTVPHWSTPKDIIKSAAQSFRLDKWKTQNVRVEVWIEKEALAGVMQRICNTLDVPYIACKGYMSQSEMWAAAMRYVTYIEQGKEVQIFHFGDHDPSGIDMSRDIEDRLRLFIAHHTSDGPFDIKRIALNMDQVEQYDPPENPAKITDTRFADYEAKFGDKSWELDALNPRTLAALVNDNVLSVRDGLLWEAEVKKELRCRAQLKIIADNWTPIEGHCQTNYNKEIQAETDKQMKIFNASIEEQIEEEDEEL
jgi:hypothetical protein